MRLTLSHLSLPWRCLIALVAGLGYPLAFSPWEWVPLLPLSLGVLWWLLHLADRRQSTWLAYSYGVGLFGLGVPWVYVSMATFGGTNPILSALFTGIFVLFLALFTGLAGWLLRRLQPEGELSPLLFIAVWMAVDWLRGWVGPGFPWLFPGYAAIDTPLARLAGWGGVWLVSIAMLATGLCVGCSLTRRRHLPLFVLAALCWLAAFLLPVTPGITPQGEPQPVALVQANIRQTVKWDPAQQTKTRDVYQRLTATIADRKSLVIWSESALTEFYRDAREWLETQAQPFASAGGALIAGLPRLRIDPSLNVTFYNSLLVVAGGHGIYNKQRLVPFGEYVPLESVIRGLVPFFDLPMSSFTAGGENQPNLRATDRHFAPFVCYDVLFPRLVARQARGSQALIEVSDDAWFGDSAAPWQHFQMARMRSVETGRWLLRDTNNGVTALVDGQGRVVASLPQFSEGVLTGTYQPVSGATPYMRGGQWLALALTLLLLAGGLAERRRQRPTAERDGTRRS